MRQKISTISILWLSIGVSIWLIGGFWITLLLLAVALGVTLHLLWIKTYRPEQHAAARASVTEQV